MRHDFVTIADLSKEKIMYLLEMAQEFEKYPNRELLKRHFSLSRQHVHALALRQLPTDSAHV